MVFKKFLLFTHKKWMYNFINEINYIIVIELIKLAEHPYIYPYKCTFEHIYWHIYRKGINAINVQNRIFIIKLRI